MKYPQIVKNGKHWTFYAGFHKKFQGLGLMWEEDMIETLISERHYCIELRLLWIRVWFDYNRMSWFKITTKF